MSSNKTTTDHSWQDSLITPIRVGVTPKNKKNKTSRTSDSNTSKSNNSNAPKKNDNNAFKTNDNNTRKNLYTCK